MRNNNSPSNRLPEHPATFDARLSRCRRALYFMACHVLGSPEGAEEAVQNCLLTASHNRARFERDGAFDSWLLRILIDEALLILRQKKGTGVTPEPALFRKALALNPLPSLVASISDRAQRVTSYDSK